MRKLIMWNLISLDGFIEGPNRDISWHNDVWGPELEQLSIEQGKEIGALLFARVTYELMAGTGRPRRKRDHGLHECAAEVRLLAHPEEGGLGEHDAADGRPRGGSREAEARRRKDIFVFGSAALSSHVMPLFDELRIGVAPLVLGSGSLLFKKQDEKAKLKLLGTDRHSTGVVILRYAPRID